MQATRDVPKHFQLEAGAVLTEKIVGSMVPGIREKENFFDHAVFALRKHHILA